MLVNRILRNSLVLIEVYSAQEYIYLHIRNVQIKQIFTTYLSISCLNWIWSEYMQNQVNFGGDFLSVLSPSWWGP